MTTCPVCGRGFRFGAAVYVLVPAHIDDLDVECGVSAVGSEGEDLVVHRECLGKAPVADVSGQEVLVELVRVETRSVERADCLSSLGL